MPAQLPTALPDLEALVLTNAADPNHSDETLKKKEQAVYALAKLHADAQHGDKIQLLLESLRPFFALIPKARTAKIVRHLIDVVATIPNSASLQMTLCRDSIAWCVAEKRSFLRQRIQARLAALLLQSRQYTETLAILIELQTEVKRLDDKPLLVEINLVEAQTHHELRNQPKAKAALTAARTAANAIYVPPLLQAQIDLMSGTLHAEDKDFKTAFSYFFEAFENYGAAEATASRSVDCLKYMLLCKIMLDRPEEVKAVLKGKPGMKHPGAALDAMRAVADAHTARSLSDFNAALAAHADHLSGDKIIERHLSALYDMLLEQNILRILEPYSTVETAHVASLIALPLATVDEKLAQMVLDKKFYGTLDAGSGCVVIFDEDTADSMYADALETISNLGGVVDALHQKAQKLGAAAEEKVEEKSDPKSGKRNEAGSAAKEKKASAEK